MAADADSTFARRLRAAFGASGLSLATVVAKLAKAGYNVPERSLDNWMRGFFLPRSEAAGEVVFTLGQILGADPEALVQALALDIASGRAFIPAEGTDGERLREAQSSGEVDNYRFARSDADTDWDAEPVRLAIEDRLHFSADLQSFRYRAVLDVQVPAVPNASISVPLVFGRDDIPTDPRLVFDIEGAYVAGQKVYEMPDGQVNVTTRLALSADFEPGERRRVAYTVNLTRDGDPSKVFRRFFAWPLERYACRMSFEGEIPDGLVFLASDSFEVDAIAEATRHELEVVDGRAEYVRENNPTGIGQVEWKVASE